MAENRHLSLCMIVKNEEDCIGRCLASVKDVVDEIIIVDTGSTDRTVEICRSHGAQVYDFPWNGSFAKARNYGIEKAKGNWILWLDADEAIDPEDVHHLKDLARFSDEYDMLTIHLINYYGNEPDPNNVSQISQVRLFRNHKGFMFYSDMHESLHIDDVERIGSIPVKIYHYGYLTSYVKGKRKSDRNIGLLKKQAQTSDDAWTYFYLAMEYYNIQKHQEAFDHVNQSIRKFLDQKCIPPSMIYKLKYAILIDLKCWDEALEGIRRAVLLYSDYVDLWYYMGLIYYHKEQYAESLAAFVHCIELGEENLNYYTVKGVGSFLAWYYKGLSLKALGRRSEAEFCFHHILKSYEGYAPAVEALAEMAEGSTG